jgi:hypothetical protein
MSDRNRNDDSMNLSSFFSELMRTDQLWTNHPILQRNPDTWTSEQESFFIDSLYLDFVVNPITVSRRGNSFRILEGGHRVYTIKKFMSNRFQYKGLYLKDMELSDQDRFNYRKIRYTVFTGLTDLEEEQFILRVNMGLPINSGEFVNMMPSIQLCELSRTLGNRHGNSLLEFTKMAGTKNERGDTSMAMYMILTNFIEDKLVHTERISSVLKLREHAEKFRGVELDIRGLSEKVDKLIKCFDRLMPTNKSNTGDPFIKWPAYVVMTIQAIIMKYPSVCYSTIHTFMSIVHGSGNSETTRDWKSRVPNNNPAKKTACEERCKVFERWYTYQYH